MLTLNPLSIEDLLKAHKLMMNDLVKENGRFRNGGVGIFDGNKLIHTAPPANYVPQLISDLFEWYKQSPLHILIKVAFFTMSLNLFIRLQMATDESVECGTHYYLVNGINYSLGYLLKNL